MTAMANTAIPWDGLVDSCEWKLRVGQRKARNLCEQTFPELPPEARVVPNPSEPPATGKGGRGLALNPTFAPHW